MPVAEAIIDAALEYARPPQAPLCGRRTWPLCGMSIMTCSR